MKNFKVEVSKGKDKYTLIKKAESEIELKHELHKEGFTCLSIQSMDGIDVAGNKYYFEILQNGSLKTGNISSSDIFKSYLKIKYDLKYDLKYIYLDKETPLSEKEKIMSDLEEQYNLYIKLNKKEIKKEKDLDEASLKNVVEVNINTFAMKKEVDETYKIIEKVLEKLKNIINTEDNEYLDFEKKQFLKDVYNSIFRLKNSTNLLKLRQIGELGLIKIGEIELKILEKTKDKKVKELLSQTNKLLKQVGSKKSFIEKDKDIGYILTNLFNGTKKFIEKDESKSKKSRIDIDKKSFSFLKTKVLVDKYSNKLKNINNEIIKNIFIFFIPTKQNIEKKETLILRKKVINQNLVILQSRLNGEIFSYVKLVKGYNYIAEKLITLLKIIKDYFFIILVIYSFLFFIIILLTSVGLFDLGYNFYGLFYFLILNLFIILTNYIKGLLSLILNIVILLFFFIFGVINF